MDDLPAGPAGPRPEIVDLAARLAPALAERAARYDEADEFAYDDVAELVASGYTEEVNAQFRVFLEESDFDVVAERGLGLLSPPDNLSRNELETFVIDVVRAAPSADAVVVALASTRTLESIVPLEKRCNIPVVSARPHAFWAGVRLLGLKAGVDGLGTVLAKS